MAGAELIGKEELLEINSLFEVGRGNLYRYGRGRFAALQFEEQICDYFGVKHAHVVSSGTAAIHCALAGIGVSEGDEVITTAFTFVAPIEAICHLGAIPVLVDIDSTFSLDPDEIESKITERTKAIVSIPMWSSPDMDRLVDIAERYNIQLVEDAAQALGASYKGRKLGTIGKVGSCSFDAGKTIHTGEGGVVITNDVEIYDRVTEFTDHGHMHIEGLPRGKDPRRSIGLNYRMSEVTAAIGIAQLKKIQFILDQAKSNKSKLIEKLGPLPEIQFRPHHDIDGSQGDTLIISTPSKSAARKIESDMEAAGFSTKILPEAIDWHFGGAWGHILDSYEMYSGKLDGLFDKTKNLLERSVCINIPVRWEDSTITKLANTIKVSVDQALALV